MRFLRCLAPLAVVAGLAGCGHAAPSDARALVRVNQAGYPAAGAKPAFVMVGRALGHARFTVRSTAGQIVLRGRLGRETGSWNGRWRHVYALDLAGLTHPGAYDLAVAGARARLVVGDPRALYEPLAGRAVAFFAAQRDGADVVPGALHRVPAHLLDARATVYASPRYRGLRLLSRLARRGGPVDVAGGWFDAGDYLKFTETASFDAAVLQLVLRDQARGAWAGALRAEARHGTDWLLRLWDPGRRVLYAQVGLGDGNGGSVLGDHDVWRLPQADDARRTRPGAPDYSVSHRPVFAANAPGGPISPNLAGRVAAALALCAQVQADVDPGYARRCLQAGQAIYDQADTHPHGGLLTAFPRDYYSEQEWRDDLELGAVELYLATRRLGGAGLPHPDANRYISQAGRWADAYMSSRLNGGDSLNLYDVSALAHADLVRVLRSPEYASLQRIPKNGIDVSTDPGALLADLRAQLRLAASRAGRDPFGFGSVSGSADTVPHALGVAATARIYDGLAGTAQYEGLARRQLGWTLGANAWGQSFTVGAGRDFPRCLSHQVANLAGSLSGRGALLWGATVDGPNTSGSVRDRGAPDGFRRCARPGLAHLDGRGMHYRDDVTSASTSEPTDDYAALAMLAFAQQAAG